MNRKHTRTVTARVPPALAEALVNRADELGRTVSVVLRDAVAREVSRPADTGDRSFAAAWLDGGELEPSKGN